MTTTIIKLSGKVIDNAKSFGAFIAGVRRLHRTERLVVVHGGGTQISAWMNALGLESRFVNGLRFTDERTLEVVCAVLAGLVNKRLVCALEQAGVRAVGVSGADGGMLQARIRPELGLVGDPATRTDPALVRRLLAAGYVVVVASVALGREKGGPLSLVNVNADTVTDALGAVLRPRRMVFLTDTEGVLDAQGKPLAQVALGDIPVLVRRGVVTAGMVPKLKAVARLLRRGVGDVRITNDLNRQGTVITL